MKKVRKRTPGGRTVTHYKKPKTSKHRCALCGDELKGVPHGKRPSEVRKLSHTEKRPERIFGGVLCANCTKKVIETAAYVKLGEKKLENVDMKMRPYVEIALRVVS